MAVTYDTNATQWTNPVTGNTFSYNHTCASGATVLYVFLEVTGGSVGVTVKYNNVSATSLAGGTMTVQGNGHDRYLFYLTNPTSGTHSVTVTATSGMTYGGGWSFSYLGSDTTTPTNAVGSGNTAGGINNSTSITTTVDNCVILSFDANDTGRTNNSTGTLRLWDNVQTNGEYVEIAQPTAGTGGVSYSSAVPTPSYWYNQIVAIQPTIPTLVDVENPIKQGVKII